MMTAIDYYGMLDSWFEMFGNTEGLSISEAKKIAEKISQATTDQERKKLKEELLIGTIGVVYNFIKSNDIITLCDTGYIEFDDLISSFVCAWSENLEHSVLEVGRYSTLFSRKYFEEVSEKLGINNVSNLLKIRGSGYLGALASYYRDKDNGVSVSPYFISTFSDYCDEKDLTKTMDIIERGYQLYRDYNIYSSSNTALLGFYGMIFTSIVVSEGQYNRNEDFDFSDDVIRKIDVENIFLGSKNLSRNQREVLIQAYGFDGLGEKHFCEIAPNFGLKRGRIGQIASMGISNLRCDSKVKKYNKS